MLKFELSKRITVVRIEITFGSPDLHCYYVKYFVNV